MHRHVCIIVNPAAGTAADRSPLEQACNRLRAAGARVDVQETAGPDDAERLAVEAVQCGADLIVAAGGDGTLNEVVNGIVSADGLSRCALGILPAGTGNDFARTVGIADSDAAIDALVVGRVRDIDLVSLDDRVFLNASAGGFTAETSAHVTSELKQAVGPLAYLIGGARAFLEHEPVESRIEADGRVIEAELQLFAVCNGAYIGGGHQLAPSARPDDGLVEICLVRASSTIDFLTLLPRLSTGAHMDDDDVVYFRTREVKLTFSRQIKVNTDGELLEASACHYVVNAGAIRVVGPLGVSAQATRDARG